MKTKKKSGPQGWLEERVSVGLDKDMSEALSAHIEKNGGTMINHRSSVLAYWLRTYMLEKGLIKKK